MTCAIVAAGCGGGKKAATNAPPKKAPPSNKTNPPSSFKTPDHVRGLYVTAWSAGSRRAMERLIGILDRTELNALVIDVRDDGDMYFKTGIPLAAKAKANRAAVADAKKLMDKLLAKGVYPIARIACFRDRYVPKVMPNRAVNKATGGVWKDRSGHTWLDPYNMKNWEYLAQTVDYAMKIGFPEIQLDYVRFPSEGKSDTQRFPAKKGYVDPKAKPEDVVARFALYISKRVKAQGRTLSADIFGIISSSKSDQGIGQELEKVAAPFDIISPMVYPSHFAKGEYGIGDPNRSPHAIVLKSLRDYARRLPEKKVRPWLQDFSLGVPYGKTEVQAQIKAAREVGYEDYLLWNAANKYTEAAVVDTTALAKVGTYRPTANETTASPPAPKKTH